MTSDVAVCVLCSGPCEDVAYYGALKRVTSDCRAWPAGGRLVVCTVCGAVQKPATETFLTEIARIYDSYAIYHQSSGNEQRVYAGDGGVPRSLQLLRRALEFLALGDAGRMLDVGCGNGALLQSFAELRPGWTLAGTELSDVYRAAVESVPGVESLYVGEIEAVPGRFDFITMLHSLEHFTAPADILRRLRTKFAAGGRLLIEVPDFQNNPFDLLIADHALHFSPGALRRVAAQGGYGIEVLERDWVVKELSVIAAPENGALAQNVLPEPENASIVHRAIDSLRDMAAEARTLASRGPLGIFGTSIAATWLASELESEGLKVACFVEEDENRVGRTYFNAPVLLPDPALVSGTIYVPLAPAVAKRVAQRLGTGRYRVPRAFMEQS